MDRKERGDRVTWRGRDRCALCDTAQIGTPALGVEMCRFLQWEPGTWQRSVAALVWLVLEVRVVSAAA